MVHSSGTIFSVLTWGLVVLSVCRQLVGIPKCFCYDLTTYLGNLGTMHCDRSAIRTEKSERESGDLNSLQHSNYYVYTNMRTSL